MYIRILRKDRAMEKTMAGVLAAGLAVRRVKLVRDADGAHCLDCDQVYDVETHMSLPRQWTWRKSQWMHETGTLGHRMVMFAYEE